MRNLYLILLRFREGLLYLILSIICLWLAINFNHIQRVNWMHASNSFGGTVNSASSSINFFLNLQTLNQKLALENAKLLMSLDKIKQESLILSDSLYRKNALLEADSTQQFDTTDREKFRILSSRPFKVEYIPCRIVHNTTIDNENFLTIDKGSMDGIEINNGIITDKGIIGKVVSTSEHYSLVKSVLHVHNSISAKIKSTNELGSVRWDGKSSRYVLLSEIPRHEMVKKGDTVVTTSYNSIYPANHPIGKISSVSVDENQPFWKIQIELFESLNNSIYCYVYKNQLFEEKDGLILKKDSIY